MLTKERILELLGNAPEKLEKWEQELILAENTEEPLEYISRRLYKLRIPTKKNNFHFLPPEAYDALKQENIDRNTYIKLQKGYKVTLKTLLHPKGCIRKIPEKNAILSFYYAWIAEKGTSRGWIDAFREKANLADNSGINRFLKSRNIVLPRTEKITKEQLQYLKKLLEESYKEENFTKYRALIGYIEANYNNKYPKKSRAMLQKLIGKIDNKCGQKFKKLQEAFIQKLLDSRDVTISKQQTAKCWKQLYPMRSHTFYGAVLSVGNVKKHKQIRNDGNEKRRRNRYNYDLFVEALPPSLTEEQLNQIRAAYEKAHK